MRVKHFIPSCVMILGFSWLLSSCSSEVRHALPSAAPANPSTEESEWFPVVKEVPRTQQKASVAPVPKKERTGIATGFGREVESALGYSDFTRTSGQPKYLTTIRYNDSEGAKAMGVDRSTKGKGLQKAAGGLIEWGMSGSWGTLGNYWWRGGRFVIGKKGREYQLKIKNISQARLEVVLSVDGLDVIDGEAASTKKRGYLINPGKTLVVKGFRTSHDAVASFKFSSVSRSYANLRHGSTRNIGVVGLALFTEKGREPWAESSHRGVARAFAEAPNVRARD